MKIVSLLLAGAMLTSVTALAGASPPSGAAPADAQVNQIKTAGKSAQKATIEGLNVGDGGDRKNAAAIGQLPADAEARAGEAGPEASIGLTEGGPEERLYDQVAEVWTMIRKRGLQPTPELIAREIGPDTLAQFLDRHPGATGMFGKDQDMLPVDPSHRTVLPGGGATISLPPPQGG